MLELIDAFPPPSRTTIATIEAKYGPLPGDFKAFLEQYNGAYPVRPAYVPGRIQSVYGEDTIEVQSFWAVRDEDPLRELVRKYGFSTLINLPDDLIAVATTQPHGWIILSLRERDYGSVFFLHLPELGSLATEPLKYDCLADSFSQFFSSLTHVLDDDDSSPSSDGPYVDAIWRNDYDAVEQMLNADPQLVNSEPLPGRTSIEFSSFSPRMLELLLKHGADPDQCNADGTTALCSPGCGVDSTRILLRHGADPNHVDASGRTVLMHAVQGTSTRRVRLLVEAGADARAQTPNGRSVLDSLNARSYGAEELWPIYKCLLDAGADAGAFVGTLIRWLNDHTYSVMSADLLVRLGREEIARYADIAGLIRELLKIYHDDPARPYGHIFRESAQRVLECLGIDPETAKRDSYETG